MTGTEFAARIWPAWAAAVLVTAIVVWLAFRRSDDSQRDGLAVRPFRLGLGLAGVVVAAALVLTLRRPALPVLTLGVVLVGLRRSPWRDVRQAANPAVLSGLFGLAVLLGTLARISDWPEDVVDHSGRWAVAAVAAGLAVLVNNLPASVLLASHAPSHPRALLIGLNIGPSLFVTGSLSAFLWLRAAHAVGAHPSIRTYARIGIVLVPLSIGAALAALGFLASVRL